jgi:hypothetical protein
MVLGMSLSTFTLVHVLLSLAGIGSGFIVVFGLIDGKRLNGWTAIFLVTTALTSLTGFLFPVQHLMPSHVLGFLSLAVLSFAIAARYAFQFAGAWRWIYVVGSALALYFNCFVAVVQAFEKVPALKALAPTQKEPPFLVAQLALLALFVWITILAARRFHLQPEVLRRAA